MERSFQESAQKAYWNHWQTYSKIINANKTWRVYGGRTHYQKKIKNKISTGLEEILLYFHLQYHNDTIVKTRENFFNKICTSQFIARVRKGYSRFACERELETEQKLQYFDPPLLWPSTLCLSRSPGLLNRRPRCPLCWVLHLISNFSGPQLNRGPRAPSTWRGFPYHISSITPSDL